MTISPVPLSFNANTIVSIPVNPVKTAEIDAIIFDDNDILIENMAQLLFENISSQEIISISRNDIVNGQTISYQPIKNLVQIQQEYNPNNIISQQTTSDKYFANFTIRFDDRVPSVGTGPNGEIIYIDPETGDLVVDIINSNADEQVEIEVVSSGTIYEVEL
ncbi:MAG: hypothetical protein ACO3UU_03725 [Minisyncoccia bacterium]